MSALRWIGLFTLSALLATPLLAQTDRGPVPPAEFAPYDVTLGYCYVNTNLSGNPTVNLNGLESSAKIEFQSRWGATLDSSYVRAGRDPGSGHSSYVWSILAGPMFVPAQNRNTRWLVRGLVGASLVDGSVQVNPLYYRGWQSRFSWAIGTGIERNLAAPFAVRFNADYLRTKYVSSAVVVEPQNGIRLSASLVFRFGTRHEPRSIAAR
jgi:Outer membrane protein beta-barrel domain